MNSLDIQLFDGKDGTTLALLKEDVSYMYTSETQRIYIYVKKGFIFDGASIPKMLWGILGSPFSGKYRVAAVIHDALYASKKLPRKQADDIFYNHSHSEGVTKTQATAMYAGVFAFGWLSYGKNPRYTTEQAGYFVTVKVEEI